MTTTLHIDFEILVAARTVDGSHGADKAPDLYTQRASGKWHFDGSGTFDAAGVWTAAASAENAGDAAFTEVQSGVIVDWRKLDKDAANIEFRKTGGFRLQNPF